MRVVHIKIYLPEFIYRLSVALLLCYRRFRYGCPFRRIPLTQGKFAIVDPEDYEGLAKYKWPEKIVFADVLRNPSGKIDKPKLREMYVESAPETK